MQANPVQPPSADALKIPQVGATDATAEIALRIVFGLIAAIAVLVIVIAGLRMAASGNDPEKIARAKRTIIFAFVGLAIAIGAQAIVAVVTEGLF